MNYRTLLVVVSVALVPVCVPAQEVNLGYDKTDPIVLALDQEYAGSTVADRERKYFMAHVEPEVEYRIDLTGLSVDLDLYYKGADATFLRDSLARSTNADDNDERIRQRDQASGAPPHPAARPQPVQFLPGEPLRLTNADGHELTARVVDIVGRAALVECLEPPSQPRFRRT